MDLKSFKKLALTKTPQEKLYLLSEITMNMGDARVHRNDASWRRNDKEVAHYEKEIVRTNEACIWLYNVIYNDLNKIYSRRIK